MKKRVFKGILLLSVLSVFLYAGCVAGLRKNGADTEHDLPYVRLKVLLPFSNGKQADLPEVNEEINKYLKRKLNCELDIEGLDFNTWRDRQRFALQGGEQVDLVWCNADLLISQMTNYEYLPLDDLLNSYGSNIKNNIPDILLKGAHINGKLYAVPVSKEIANSYGMYYTKEIAERNGIDVTKIRTMYDLEPVLKTIKDSEQGIIPLYMDSLAGVIQLPINRDEVERYENVSGVSVLTFDKTEKKMVNIYEQPYIIEKFKLIKKWRELGYINEDAAITSVSIDEAIKAGRAWISWGTGKPCVESGITFTTGREAIRGYTSVPKISSDSLMGSMIAIPASSASPERAMMVLDLFYSDEYLYNLLINGIEGRHYVKESDNIIKLPGNVGIGESGYFPGADWIIGNTFLGYLWTTDSLEKHEKYKEYNEEAVFSEIYDFVFDPAEVKSELTAISNIHNQYVVALETGLAEDVDAALSEFSKQLYESGFDKVLKEAQRQYDEYIKNKE